MFIMNNGKHYRNVLDSNLKQSSVNYACNERFRTPNARIFFLAEIVTKIVGDFLDATVCTQIACRISRTCIGRRTFAIEIHWQIFGVATYPIRSMYGIIVTYVYQCDSRFNPANQLNNFMVHEMITRLMFGQIFARRSRNGNQADYASKMKNIQEFIRRCFIKRNIIMIISSLVQNQNCLVLCFFVQIFFVYIQSVQLTLPLVVFNCFFTGATKSNSSPKKLVFREVPRVFVSPCVCFRCSLQTRIASGGGHWRWCLGMGLTL